MKSTSENIRDLYQREADLHEELLECIKSERENLINLNIDNLWELMESKNRILTTIQEGRDQIKSLLEEAGGKQNVSNREKPLVAELSNKIITLKQEIGARVKENVSFIKESLQFVDDLITIFAMGGKLETSYSPAKRQTRETPGRIYRREV